MSEEKKFIDVDEDDYQVGYGNPPKHAQYKKGQSGNPRGRPKQRLSYEQDEFPLRRMMMEQAVVTIRGKKERMPRYQVIMMSIINKAMGGDLPSQKLAVTMSGGFTGLREEWKRQKSQADEEYFQQVFEAAENWGKDKSDKPAKSTEQDE